MAKTLEQFIGDYVSANGRGCPKGVLQFVGGFNAATIDEAVENGTIESMRGPQGGFFVAGTKPEPQSDSPITLKYRLVEELRSIRAGNAPSLSTIDTLLQEYQDECRKRSDAKKASSKR